MRTIVVLLIAALVLTPTLAHATVPSGEGALVLVAIPVLVILLLVYLAKKYPAAAETPSPLPREPSMAVPAPVVSSDR